MPRRCKVCSSPHRLEYEKMYLEEKKRIKEIWIIARNKYNEKISYDAMRRHMRNHVDYYLKLEKRIKEEKQRLYERIIKQDLKAAERLVKNLEICSDRIEELARRKDLTPKDQELLLKWLSETRLLAEEIIEWGQKIDFTLPSEDSDTIVDIIKDVIKDFPEEYQILLIERLENYVKEKYG